MKPFRILSVQGTALVLGAALALGAAACAPAAAAELTVVVADLRSARGSVHLAVWDRAEGFTEQDAALIQTERPAADGQVRFELGKLAPGFYALAAFHDENGNGRFDRTWIGWPDEGLAFSNGAWIGLGAPSFKEAAFEVQADAGATEPQVVVVPLRYPARATAPSAATDSK
jgi:uncharacterized protein (DUF2141 family)